MKYLASLYTLITISIIFFIPQVTFADTYVSQSSNGSSSTNINVQTNTGGNSINDVTENNASQSTVCCNGNCTTTNGTYDSDKDGCNVHINSNDNAPSSSVTVTISPTLTDVPTISPSPSLSPVPTLTPDPTIAAMRHTVKKEIRKQIRDIKQHMKDQNAAISAFFQSEIHSIQSMFNSIF